MEMTCENGPSGVTMKIPPGLLNEKRREARAPGSDLDDILEGVLRNRYIHAG
jgi:hypothetical protein